jgi:hypothetical protein
MAVKRFKNLWITTQNIRVIQKEISLLKIISIKNDQKNVLKNFLFNLFIIFEFFDQIQDFFNFYNVQ